MMSNKGMSMHISEAVLKEIETVTGNVPEFATDAIALYFSLKGMADKGFTEISVSKPGGRDRHVYPGTLKSLFGR